MELWIRSQDRKVLTKVNEIWVSAQNSIYCNDDWEAGEYETEERALEVLDEIQEFIENKGKIKITQDINGITSEVEDAKRVYQMPLE